MNLQELNESYDEYLLTEEYLVEGLKVFKKSSKLYKFANKMDRELIKLKDKGKADDVTSVTKLSKDVKALADEYKAVEDAFANKDLDKKTAKAKLKTLAKHNDQVLTTVKSKQMKSAMKKVGLGLTVGALAAGVAAIAINPGLIQAAGAVAGKGIAALKGVMAKIGLGAADAVTKATVTDTATKATETVTDTATRAATDGAQ